MKKLPKILLGVAPFVVGGGVAAGVALSSITSNHGDRTTGENDTIVNDNTNNNTKFGFFKHLYSSNTNKDKKDRAIKTFAEELTIEKLQEDFDKVLSKVYENFIYENDKLDKKAWVKSVRVLNVDTKEMVADLSVDYFVEYDDEDDDDDDDKKGWSVSKKEKHDFYDDDDKRLVVENKRVRYNIKPTFFTTEEYKIFVENFKEDYDDDNDKFDVDTDNLNSFYNGKRGKDDLISRFGLKEVEGGYLGYEFKITDLAYLPITAKNHFATTRDRHEIKISDLLKSPMLAPSVSITDFIDDNTGNGGDGSTTNPGGGGGDGNTGNGGDGNTGNGGDGSIIENKNEILIKTIQEIIAKINDKNMIGSNYQSIFDELISKISNNNCLGQDNLASINIIENPFSLNSVFTVNVEISILDDSMLDQSILNSTNYNGSTKTYTLSNVNTGIAFLELGTDLSSKPSSILTVELWQILERAISSINSLDTSIISNREIEIKDSLNNFLNKWTGSNGFEFVSSVELMQVTPKYGVVGATNVEFMANVNLSSGLYVSNYDAENMINFAYNSQEHQLQSTISGISGVTLLAPTIFTQNNVKNAIKSNIGEYENGSIDKNTLIEQLKTSINSELLRYVLYPQIDSDGDGIKDEFFDNNVLTQNAIKNVSIVEESINGVKQYTITIDLKDNVYIAELPLGTIDGMMISLDKPHEIICKI